MLWIIITIVVKCIEYKKAHKRFEKIGAMLQLHTMFEPTIQFCAKLFSI